MKRATIKDVAIRAGVSISLVSKIVNAPRDGDGLPVCKVREDTLRRVLEAINVLGYRPNRAAASLRRGKENRIGIILPDISNRFFADLSRDIENIAYANGFTVIFGSSDENPDKLGNLLDSLTSDGVDGLIVIPCCGCENCIRRIADTGTPIVIAVRDLPSIGNIGRVLDDSVTATQLALDHLVGSGYRAIEMVSPSMRLSNVIEREDLYESYMKSHSLGGFIKVNHVDDNDKETSSRFILEDCVRRGVQALYFPCASLPLIFLTEATSLGLKIPDDIAIFGYDGGKDYLITNPTISQIMYSRKEMAESAFNMLCRMMDGGPVPETVNLKPSLATGGSTAIPDASGAQNPDDLLATLTETIRSLNKTIIKLKQNEQ